MSKGLRVEEYHKIDMEVPFNCALPEKSTAYSEDGEMTKVNRLYSKLVVETYGRQWSGRGNHNKWIVWFLKHTKELNE